MEQPIKTEKIIEFLSELFKTIEEKRIHYILLSISFILVALSIAFDRYFFETFLTFIYSVIFTHIQLARKQEFVDSWEIKKKQSYYAVLYILFVFSTLFWIIFEILRSF